MPPNFKRLWIILKIIELFKYLGIFLILIVIFMFFFGEDLEWMIFYFK
jgi:hypothetical protein